VSASSHIQKEHTCNTEKQNQWLVISLSLQHNYDAAKVTKNQHNEIIKTFVMHFLQFRINEYKDATT
jgi:N-acetyl-anhydromuramyl-L-alanine amidase AmpD